MSGASTVGADNPPVTAGSDPAQSMSPTLNGVFARRGVVVAAAVFGSALGFALTDSPDAADAINAAGADLTRLLRAMAVIKVIFVALALAALGWRLQEPLSWPKLLAYSGATLLMTTGVGLVWHIAEVGLGAALLHAGLLATTVMLWFDKGAARLLQRRLGRSLRNEP